MTGGKMIILRGCWTLFFLIPFFLLLISNPAAAIWDMGEGQLHNLGASVFCNLFWGQLCIQISLKKFLGVSIAFRDVWNQLLIKLPGTVIHSRAR